MVLQNAVSPQYVFNQSKRSIYVWGKPDHKIKMNIYSPYDEKTHKRMDRSAIEKFCINHLKRTCSPGKVWGNLIEMGFISLTDNEKRIHHMVLGFFRQPENLRAKTWFYVLGTSHKLLHYTVYIWRSPPKRAHE